MCLAIYLPTYDAEFGDLYLNKVAFCMNCQHINGTELGETSKNVIKKYIMILIVTFKLVFCHFAFTNC